MSYIVIIGILVILGGLCWSQYNTMVSQSAEVDLAVGNLNAQYQRRSDLLNNLIEVVKREADYEKSTLKDIVAERARAANGGRPVLDPANLTPEQIEAFNKNAASEQRMISVIIENYPQLKATEAYNKLMDETSGTENRVNVSRERFNKAVKDYNLAVQRFPGVLFAKLFGYKTKAYFENKAGTEDAPDYKNKF